MNECKEHLKGEGDVVGKRGGGIGSGRFDQNSSATCMNIKYIILKVLKRLSPVTEFILPWSWRNAYENILLVPCQRSSKVLKCLDHRFGVVGSRFDMTPELWPPLTSECVTDQLWIFLSIRVGIVGS